MTGTPSARRHIGALACVISVLGIVGCDAGVPPDQDPDDRNRIERADAGPAAPTLYLDQIAELVEPDGTNPLREGYRAHLANCLDSDAPTTPLSAADEDRLGTQRWRTWRTGDRYAWHREAWIREIPSAVSRDTMCRFAVRRTGRHGFLEADYSLEIDLETGERFEGSGNPAVVLMAKDVDVAQEAAGARLTGMSGPTPRTVGGLSCDEWKTRLGATVCIWSGAAGWGISSVPATEISIEDPPDHAEFLLEVSPPQGRAGMRLRTLEATTRELPDEPGLILR